jgi:hypothetical protein
LHQPIRQHDGEDYMEIILTIAAIRRQLSLTRQSIAELDDAIRLSRATVARSRKTLARLRSPHGPAPLWPPRPSTSTIQISPSTIQGPHRGKRPSPPSEPQGWQLAHAVAGSLRRMGFICSVMDPDHPPRMQ